MNKLDQKTIQSILLNIYQECLNNHSLEAQEVVKQIVLQLQEVQGKG